jgi:hypothetical protein
MRAAFHVHLILDLIILIMLGEEYSSPDIIRRAKSRMRWVRHVTRMGRRRMRIGFWWKSRKERDHQKDLDIDGRVISKWILEK